MTLGPHSQKECSIVTLHGKCTLALTFENVDQRTSSNIQSVCSLDYPYGMSLPCGPTLLMRIRGMRVRVRACVCVCVRIVGLYHWCVSVVCVYTCVCTHTHTCVMCVYTCVCTYMHSIYIHTYVYMVVYQTHTHTHRFNDPMRMRTKPHPIMFTMYFLDHALKMLTTGALTLYYYAFY